jgi:hypothetical protein
LDTHYQAVAKGLRKRKCGSDPEVPLWWNSFIPTVSAVGIGGDPTVPIDKAKSPFDHVWVCDDNNLHCALNPDMKKWLLDLICPESEVQEVSTTAVHEEPQPA